MMLRFRVLRQYTHIQYISNLTVSLLFLNILEIMGFSHRKVVLMTSLNGHRIVKEIRLLLSLSWRARISIILQGVIPGYFGEKLTLVLTERCEPFLLDIQNLVH